MIALLAQHDSTLGLSDILFICLPATLLGCLIGAFSVWRMGPELEADPIYLERLRQGLITETALPPSDGAKYLREAWAAIVIFALAVLGVVLVGLFPELRPSFVSTNGATKHMSMSHCIQMVMLSAGALIMLVSRAKSDAIVQSSVMRAGVVAVISILGIAWLGSTFFEAFQKEVVGAISHLIEIRPGIFSLGLFVLSILLYSQAATVAALMHVGVTLGIPLPLLIAMFPAVNGYFFLPTYGTIVAAISFDQTGTTRIGKYILNHSFMRPGLVSTISAVLIGLIIAKTLY